MADCGELMGMWQKGGCGFMTRGREGWHPQGSTSCCTGGAYTCKAMMVEGSAASGGKVSHWRGWQNSSMLRRLPHASAGLSALPTAMFATCRGAKEGQSVCAVFNC